jgi:hypothetical protein
MKWMVALTLALLAGPSQAAEKFLHFYGYAYDLKTNQYLYTEVHSQRVDGDHWIGGSMNYFAPDGKKIASKTLNFGNDPYIPVYRLDQLTDGYVEGISKVGDEIELYKRESSKTKMETGSEDREPLMAADSGFHNFIRAHFDELMKGDTLSFRLIVAGQLDAYQFRLRKIGETQFEGKPAVILIAEPDSLLRLMVDPLHLTYDPVSHKLLEYRGVSNLHDPATGKIYEARIIYPSATPADAPKNLPPLK